ncbi:hypothetical protein HDF24_07075 [Mucilaginibacter sp. X4EP1]|uniref:hypothetical protein n=1 Tax=Mucilaginibacter sp. X4EP1 TaxID=2723092 RepID=UPI002169206C|nr:hypothetical protein [Mucilaginibacter sp. X4EP1]MCS3814071.1 cytoskeletal protein RodZ [Mucilaginibacter sp. X4EP1]
MNNEKDKNLDDLFSKKLQDPANEAGFREEDWDSLEDMLDGQKKRRGIIFWLPVLGSVAALLLLFLGWWAFRPETNVKNSQNNMQAVSKHPNANTGINGGAARQPEGVKQNKPLPKSYADNSQPGKSSNESKSFFTLSATGSRHNTGTGSSASISNDLAATKSNDLTISATSYNKKTLTAVSPAYAFNQEGLADQNVSAVKYPNKNVITPVVRDGKTISKQKPAFRPQYALTILAAPDANGVGSFQQSKLGTNVGVAFSANITKKLTISTGAIYSVKPYSAEYGEYHLAYQPAQQLSNVVADCRMFDIPLNVGYQIYNKHQNKISLGTGLSTYIMLHESYTFNYADPALTPGHYTVPNSNSYFLGVANFNATYEHRINSKVSIMLQPYLKLPLTNIGYSQVRLQTTGVALGLSWNLTSLSKP